RGTITVSAYRPDGAGWVAADLAPVQVGEQDRVAVADAATALLAQVPTRHRDPDQPTGVAFGYKTVWLAVRDAEPAAVADALALCDQRAVSWRDGVAASDRAGVF